MPNKYDEQTVPADFGRLELQAGAYAVHTYLVVLTGPSLGSLFRLEKAQTLIGRSADADVVIDDESISREHAMVARSGTGHLVVHDLNSTNGTFKNGTRVQTTTVREGERFQVGGTVLLRLSLAEGVEESFRQLYDASIRDPLTGLHNRRHFFDRLGAELSFAQRHDRPVALIMLDVDHFKSVNDTFGHQAGDHVLRKVAEMLQGTVRAEDIVARYGGEEFVVLVPGTGGSQAVALAERLRARVESAPMVWEGSRIRVTVSAGVACREGGSSNTTIDLLGAADAALYRAKQEGRNKVVAAPAPTSLGEEE